VGAGLSRGTKSIIFTEIYFVSTDRLQTQSRKADGMIIFVSGMAAIICDMNHVCAFAHDCKLLV
jgi:hypothetical protein